jgi:hypothetical protein
VPQGVGNPYPSLAGSTLDLKTSTNKYLQAMVGRLFGPAWGQVRLVMAETLLVWAASIAPAKSHLRLRVCQFLLTVPGRDD